MRVLYCRKCGSRIPDDSVFCMCCGTKVEFINNHSTNNKADISSEPFGKEEQIEQRLRVEVKKHLDGQPHVPSDQTSSIKIDPVKRVKRKRIITAIIVASIATALIATGLTVYIKNEMFNHQLRNMATESMSDNYKNVYADVISIEPVYGITERKTTRTGAPIGDESLKEIVCRCKTVEDTYIWAVFFVSEYPGGAYGKSLEELTTITYPKDKPERLRGNITTPKKINSELGSTLDVSYILDVGTLYY